MITLNPTAEYFTVPKRDSEPTEFEVQAYLYSTLKQLGINVRGEVSHRCPRTRRSFRFDLVIYQNEEASEIIEVKSAPIKHKRGLEKTRQATRYRWFGLPVTFIYGMEDADRYLAPLRGGF